MTEREDWTRRDFVRVTANAAAGAAALPALAADASPASTAPPAGPSQELTMLTIAQASRMIRAREISSTELTRACLERAEAYNPKVNAFITIMHDEALRQARQLDLEANGGNFRGPLHGIPIALKDNIDTAGTRTTGGSLVFEENVPEEDAFVVRRLKASGAVILAKAGLQEFAMGGSNVSTYFLPVRNPWALDHISGGSSGGSAAAVIADMALGALGTDTGGSVRMPAAYCSIVGLKPTYGLVSIGGIIPRTYSLDHCGPMTKTAEDSALLLSGMVGYDKHDVASIEHPPEDYAAAARQSVGGLRLGIPREPFFDFLDDEIAAAVEEAIDVLGGLAGSVGEMRPPAAGAILEVLPLRGDRGIPLGVVPAERQPLFAQPEAHDRSRAPEAQRRGHDAVLDQGRRLHQCPVGTPADAQDHRRRVRRP